MRTTLERYKDIMRRYRTGEFGNNCLYLHQILALAGDPDILNEMTYDELFELISNTDDVFFKSALTQILKKKIIKKTCHKYEV